MFPSGECISHPLWTKAATFWEHMEFAYNAGASGGGGPNWQWFDGSTVVAQFTTLTSAVTCTIKVYTLQSGVLTLAGSIGPFANAVRQTLDIKLVAGASGSCAAYNGGDLIFSVTGLDHTGFTGVDKVRMLGVNTILDNWQFSQIFHSTKSTIGKKLKTLVVNGNGATSAWTGSYTDIDELVTNDGTSISSPTAAQVSTFTTAGGASGPIRALIVTTRLHKGDTGGPQSYQPVVRVSGTDYFGSTVALDDGFTAEEGIWETNPATGVSWVDTEVNAAQIGVKSIA